MLSNVTSGYGLAWARRRQLLPVLLVVLVPMAVAVFTLDVVSAAAEAPVINGVFVFSHSGGLTTIVQLALIVLSWLLAVTAGCVTVIELSRLPAALATAARRLPLLAIGLLVLMAFSAAAVWVAAHVSAIFGARLALVVLLAALAALAVVLARLVFAVATTVFGGSSWALTRGRVAATAGAFLLGGVALPLLLVWLLGSWRSALPPLLMEAVNSIAMIAAVACQVGIISHIYLLGRETVSTDEVPQPVRRWWWVPVVAGLLAPTLASAAVAAANPYGAPTLQAHGDGPAGGPMAVAWPPAMAPIIVSNAGIRFCDDDLCTSFVSRGGGPPIMEGYGTVVISPEGVVAKAVLMGGSENGGPFIHYGLCTRDQGCAQGWVPSRASADEPFVWAQLAPMVAKDGRLWLALAVPPPIGQPAPVTAELKLLRCDDAKCANPKRFSLGKVDAQPREGDGPARYGRLSFDADGRPRLLFEIDGVLRSATCAPVTCADPVIGVAQRSAPSTGYSVAAEPVNAPGLHLYIGQRPKFWRYVLKGDNVRVPLDVVRGQPRQAMVAGAEDGRLLVVREDRLTLVPRPT